MILYCLSLCTNLDNSHSTFWCLPRKWSHLYYNFSIFYCWVKITPTWKNLANDYIDYRWINFGQVNTRHSMYHIHDYLVYQTETFLFVHTRRSASLQPISELCLWQMKIQPWSVDHFYIFRISLHCATFLVNLEI